ncbi:MAG: hypothetical protein ACYSTL_07790, partial [Planctomycetota bacterium]
CLTFLLICLVSPDAFAGNEKQKPREKPKPAGIELRNGPLQVHVTDNSARFFSQIYRYADGYNGLGSLKRDDQQKNIFAKAGFNLECASAHPKTGALLDKWNAPRLATMKLEKISGRSARLTQKGAEAAGVNVEIVYTLGKTYVDMSCSVWADGDVQQIKTFWASYMNQVQNTSLYLRGKLNEAEAAEWYELTSPTHNGPRGYRPFDPKGKDWYDYLTDNPVRRQVMKKSPDIPAAKAAQEKAGFKPGKLAPGSFENFFYGFIDDYLFLTIFRPSKDVKFIPWISPVGGGAVRSPAWDFTCNTLRSTKAGEKVTFHVRLVYKKFAGLVDLLEEVKAFQEAPLSDK